MINTQYQKELFFNRLQKRYKHLKKWAKRTDTKCYRLYDKDIPEIPLSVDIYENTESKLFASICLYKRPYEVDENEEFLWLEAMRDAASSVLNIDKNAIFIKIREKQKGLSQYEKITNESFVTYVEEHGLRFKINLSSYLDTGLFFDHRPLHETIMQTASDKDILNLYCYTGSFSVHAAKGNAKSVDSVDLSKNYLAWAEENMNINGFNTKSKDEKNVLKYRFINEDVLSFIQSAKNATNAKRNRWDIIILDPPTFSNSKKTENTLDINKDYIILVNVCLELLNKGGTLYFSSNSRKLRFDEEKIIKKTSENLSVSTEEITEKTIPEDFRNQNIHKCWKFQVANAPSADNKDILY